MILAGVGGMKGNGAHNRYFRKKERNREGEGVADLLS